MAIYDYAKLFNILKNKADASPILARNAFPFLLRNNSEQPIDFVIDGKPAKVQL